jgi:hypothetical protein
MLPTSYFENNVFHALNFSRISHLIQKITAMINGVEKRDSYVKGTT